MYLLQNLHYRRSKIVDHKWFDATKEEATSSKEKLDVAFNVSRRCLEKRGARRDVSARNQWR